MNGVVSVVGAGVSVASFADALCDRADLPDRLELRLVARDGARLRTLAGHVSARAATRRPRWTVRSTTDLDTGVRGADAVVLAVRIGGGRARMHDEVFPRQFGHVGDEGLGLGGIANAWRSVPELARMARTIRGAAPDAAVWNLVAPLGVTTRVLIDEGLRAVGLCELPEVTVQRLTGRVERPDRRPLQVGGLNHLSWCWTELGAEDRALRDAAVSAGLVHEDDWERYGAVPLPYHYRVLRPELGEELGITQPAGRAQQLVEWSARVLACMDEHPGEDVEALTARPTPWWDRAVVPALAATMGGQPHRGWCNVVNHGLLPGLPADVVVEVPAMFDEHGVHPRALTDPPKVALDLLRRWAELDRGAHRAARDRDVSALRDALGDLPSEIALRGPDEVDRAVAEICTDPSAGAHGREVRT